MEVDVLTIHISYGVQECANESAASTASLDYVKFRGHDQVGCERSLQQDEDRMTDDARMTARHADDEGHGAPLDFGLPGGCASSRVDHDLEILCNPGRPR